MRVECRRLMEITQTTSMQAEKPKLPRFGSEKGSDISD